MNTRFVERTLVCMWMMMLTSGWCEYWQMLESLDNPGLASLLSLASDPPDIELYHSGCGILLVNVLSNLILLEELRDLDYIFV